MQGAPECPSRRLTPSFAGNRNFISIRWARHRPAVSVIPTVKLSRSAMRLFDAPIVEGQPHPKITLMIAHWRDLAPAPGVLPGRQHFDPIRVPTVLPNIWLLDVVRGARVRYRIRLVGGALVDAGAPMRPGVFLDELGEWIDPHHMNAIFDEVERSRLPNWRRGKPAIRHSRYISDLERVFLPFASDGQTIDLIMGITVFYRSDGEIY
jgi:hypothetical protein